PYDYADHNAFFEYASLIFQKTVYRFISEFIQLFKIGAMMIGGNSFMRASALEKAGGFNTAITFYGDDTDTAKRVVASGKIVFDPKLVIRTSARRFNNQGN